MQPGPIVINGATSQLDRWLDALGPGYAQVDGRSFATLLGFPAAFGRLINFYDLDDKIDGNWRDFFLYDPTIALARLAAMDVAALTTDYHTLVQRTRGTGRFEDKFALLTQLFTATAQPARDIDAGLRALSTERKGDAVLSLRLRIAALIEDELAAQLHRLADYARGAGARHALGHEVSFDTADFLPLWNLEDSCADGAIYSGASRQRKIDHALPHLQAIFDTFCDALGGLRATAEADLAASLASGDHKPHIALYIAFAKLFESAQNTINTLPERYNAFYYHDILREDYRGATPDSVYLAFQLANQDGVTSTVVPAGTLFGAGQDKDGIDILYGAQKSLAVTSATVADLRTLRQEFGPLPQAPGKAEAPGDVLRRIFTSAVSIKPAKTADAAWPTFGTTEAGQGASEVTALATLGFAVASSYLLLAGGTRALKLRLSYSPESAAILNTRLARISQFTGVDPQVVLHDVLMASFDLSVSTAKGWLAIEGYDVTLAGADAAYFDIAFTLPPTAAAIAPFDPEKPAPTDGPNPAPALPTLRALLRQQSVALGQEPRQAQVYPLSLLEPLRLTTWSIDAEVTSFTVAALSNTDGSVDPTKPFLPLGAPPVVGSFLEIRAPELFVKRIATLDVAISWFNLPQDATGFKGWYHDYTIGMSGKTQENLFDNTTFRVAIDVVNPGSWTLTPLAGDATCLFRTKDTANPSQNCIVTKDCMPLCQTTVFAGLLPLKATPPPYYDPTASAVRIQLTDPPYAFGEQLYPVNVLACVIADLPPATTTPAEPVTPPATPSATGGAVAIHKPVTAASTTPTKEAATIAYPNPPWLPQATGVSLHYTAKGASGDADGTFFYLMPFEGTAAAAPSTAAPMPLLPDYAAPGNLYIGLSGLLLPQTQTLLFQMSAGGAGWSESETPLSWEILSGNAWVALSKPEILGDGTNQLQNSGIATLNLPAIEIAPGTVMPPELRWLHVAAGDPDRHPDTAGVFANALTARCRDAAGLDRFAGPLPAGTIASSVQDLPYVQTILQPAPSFGGRPAEAGAGFKTWLGERLRHKNRGVLSWDIERLVLEAFPAMWKVQALAARDLARGDAPGSILVVVVPGPNSSDAQDPTAPWASADTLSQIGESLEAVVSPFVSIAVSNPNYVRVTVRAKVQFAADDNSSAYLKRLNNELIEYLSPWFYDAERAETGGDYASEDDIAEFIETRPYVDALVSLELGYDPRRETLDWYFLTSAKAHDITAVDSWDPCEAAVPAGAPVQGAR